MPIDPLPSAVWYADMATSPRGSVTTLRGAGWVGPSGAREAFVVSKPNCSRSARIWCRRGTRSVTNASGMLNILPARTNPHRLGVNRSLGSPGHDHGGTTVKPDAETGKPVAHTRRAGGNESISPVVPCARSARAGPSGRGGSRVRSRRRTAALQRHYSHERRVGFDRGCHPGHRSQCPRRAGTPRRLVWRTIRAAGTPWERMVGKRVSPALPMITKG